MKLIYLTEDIPTDKVSVFLAGGTYDDPNKSWRFKASTYLFMNGFSGNIFIPEKRDPNQVVSREHQIEWQEKAINTASAVLMWIPRSLKSVGQMPDGSPKLDLPCFTTNVEFGQLLGRSGFFYGRPDDSPMNKGLDYRYEKHHTHSFASSLEELAVDVMSYLLNSKL